MPHSKTTNLVAAGIVAAAAVISFPHPALAQSTETVLTARTFIEVSRQVLPSVVSIDVSYDPAQRRGTRGASTGDGSGSRSVDPPGDLSELEDFFRNFTPRDFGYFGSGSGVVVDSDDEWAYVITNRHVIVDNPRTRYSITLDSSYGRLPVTIEGDQVSLVGTDELTDLALLRFRVPDNLQVPAVDFADSDSVEVGEWVLALGNPLDLNNSVSQGIISARNRSLMSTGSQIENLLQTTAVINPGNSGGPLVNLDGKVVGINNAIKTQTGRWAGIGFAIPSNYARHVAEDLIEHGRVRRGYIGISMESVEPRRFQRATDPAAARARTMLADHRDHLSHGVVVINVQSGTPAENAGLIAGDVIIAVGDDLINDTQNLLESVATRRVGESVALTILRPEGDSLVEVVRTLELMERPSARELAQQIEMRVTREALNELGLEVENTREGGVEGLRVVSVESRGIADRAGLRRGDIITRVDETDVKELSDMRTALMESSGNSLIINFRRGNSNQTVTLDLPTRRSRD